jgi:histidine triad (HIT) family protein
MTDCIFCKIVAGQIPARMVKETNDAIAFHDVNPQAPVHVLVVPRSHFPAARDASEAVLGHLVALGTQVARELELDHHGYRLVVNTGDHGGQTVHHLHLHLLGGRAMGWPPG